MAFTLQNWTVKKQRDLIRFLTSEGSKLAAMRRLGGCDPTHDNELPHFSMVPHAELAKFKWVQLDHPAYSPDISPCDSHMFGSLRRGKGKRFNSVKISIDILLKSHKSLSSNEPLSKPCYIDCPVDCVLSEWSAWNQSACIPCGSPGIMTRTRYVVQKPSDAGQPCSPEMEQRKPCDFKACYHWKHSDWSSCDLEYADCGYGVRRRVVECIRYDGLQVDKIFCLTLNLSFPMDNWIDPSWLNLAQEDSVRLNQNY
ncbi:thrombospondin type-1 domain-containing protein 7A [Trichonephila inaurata madagascariensis]|uniref:Thrombospondin type-1 domain-containing protein 7A n=1 Tax=Trichonephila inaurata madagascariensis TaxID=2747483 RepID=A0A8X6MGL4_9ARAC|nr:thrombospondin type-1 domain-containing protein 7A [Trichonephila inaurata madagascariensis]